MCDLWRNTTDAPVPPGAIPAQIDVALGQLPPAQHVKLYNSGNFFDRQAIPPEDYTAIADRVRMFRTVTVENHPRFCRSECPRFRDLLGTDLAVGIGLETAHREILDRLNKRMTLEDFERAVGFLRHHAIGVRAFVLLRPPFMEEQEGVEWAVRSIEYAFSVGVQCCSVIPTRTGNGALERLHTAGLFDLPTLSSMETVLEAGILMDRGRVFMDLWDIERFYECGRCGPLRRERMHRMNLSQRTVPRVRCDAEAHR
jgi:radical SAM enzyme (TIGR01210 family)